MAKATKPDEAGAAAAAPVGAAANAALAGQAALAGTRAAGIAVGLAANRARIPLVVGSGFAAGVAGSLAIVRRGRRGGRRGFRR